MSGLEANFRWVGISSVDRSETIRDNQGHLLVELKDSFRMHRWSPRSHSVPAHPAAFPRL